MALFFLQMRQSLKRERQYFRNSHFYRPFFRSLFKTDSICELLASILIQEADIFK